MMIVQASFLFHMGVVQRMHNLISLSSTSEEQAVELYNAFEFLVGKEGMGEKFKVISIISNKTL
jgi:SAM-dependent MidA family methyltransferase